MSTCPEDLKELLKVIYNLSSSEVEVLYYLCENSKKRVKGVAKSLKRDRSTIQRILNNLLSVGLIKRRSKTYEDNRKGRYYTYSIISKEKLKDKIKERVENWETSKIKVLELL
ncbi:MAG: helix-turn-helix domain-containing protein [Candidatus Aenigmatarchaeota archaeon]